LVDRRRGFFCTSRSAPPPGRLANRGEVGHDTRNRVEELASEEAHMPVDVRQASRAAARRRSAPASPRRCRRVSRSAPPSASRGDRARSARRSDAHPPPSPRTTGQARPTAPRPGDSRGRRHPGPQCRSVAVGGVGCVTCDIPGALAMSNDPKSFRPTLLHNQPPGTPLYLTWRPMRCSRGRKMANGSNRPLVHSRQHGPSDTSPGCGATPGEGAGMACLP
jgi:hypothetical protein